MALKAGSVIGHKGGLTPFMTLSDAVSVVASNVGGMNAFENERCHHPPLAPISPGLCPGLMEGIDANHFSIARSATVSVSDGVVTRDHLHFG